MFLKTKDSTSLPVRSNVCQNSKCYDIYSSTCVTFFPNRLNKINTGIVIDLPPDLVITVKNTTCCKQDWENVARFLFGDPQTNVIIVPIIASKICHIEAGTHLVHITLTNIDHFARMHQGITQYLRKLIFF